MTTPSTNGGHPIAFDTAGQVELQLERLRQRIDEHVQQASQGKDKAFVEQLRTMLQQVRAVESNYHLSQFV